MTILALLLGCIQAPGQKDPLDTIETTSEGRIVVDPSTLDFGDVAVGSSGALAVSVTNEGEGVLSLGAIEVVGDPLAWSVALPSDGLLDPGASTTFTVTFAPQDDGAASTRLAVNSDDATSPVVYVDASGNGVAGHLAVSASTGDLGTVQIGCEGRSTVTVLNDGNAELVVSAIDLGGTSPEFSLDYATPLPWTLAPGASATVDLVYSPVDEAPDEATVRVESTSRSVEAADVSVRGEGRAWAHGEDRLSQAGSQTLDVVLTSVGYYGYYIDAERLLTQLTSLYEELDDSHRSFRLGLLDENSCVTADPPYADDTMTDSERDQALADMVEGWDGAYSLPTFEKVLAAVDPEAIGSGGCNEGLVRDDAMLMVVVATIWDDYTLSMSAEDFGEALSAIPPIPEMTRLELIGPDGSTGECSYPPPTRWYDAVEDLGGSAWSFCEEDWTGHFEGMLANLPEEVDRIVLSQSPVEATLEVWVDDVRWDDGWYYVPAENTVRFEFDSVPAAGSVTEVRYAVAGSCPS